MSHRHIRDEESLRFTKKWSHDIEKCGYTMVPNLLLSHYGVLGLTPSELLVLLNIESYRWNSDRLPYPSVEVLAERMEVSSRTVSRLTTSLQKKDLVCRIARKGTSNVYSTYPLSRRLDIIADYVQENPQERHHIEVIDNYGVVTLISPKEDSLKQKTELKHILSNIPLYEKPKFSKKGYRVI